MCSLTWRVGPEKGIHQLLHINRKKGARSTPVLVMEPQKASPKCSNKVSTMTEDTKKIVPLSIS